MLRDRLIALVEAVHEADRMVAVDAADGVHDLRVALRRTRSLLVTFGPALSHPEAERLRRELRWAGRELGGPRDVEVVYGQLEALLGEEGVGHVSGAAVALIQDEARAADRQASSLVAALRTGERYRRLLEDLDRLPAEVPVEDPAPDVVAAAAAQGLVPAPPQDRARRTGRQAAPRHARPPCTTYARQRSGRGTPPRR